MAVSSFAGLSVITLIILSVIRQKGESQNGRNKTKHTKFSEKRTFLPPDTHTYLCVSGVRNVRFLENLVRFVLLPPFWDSPFCLITDDIGTMILVIVLFVVDFLWLKSSIFLNVALILLIFKIISHANDSKEFWRNSGTTMKHYKHYVKACVNLGKIYVDTC